MVRRTVTPCQSVICLDGEADFAQKMIWMKNDKLPMLVPLQKVGSEYIKLKSGEKVKWQSYDEKTQMFEIKSPNGEISKVHRRDIKIPTSNEDVS